MGKGFRVKGLLRGSATKKMARSSMAMEWIRDLCYDDYDESDWEWGTSSRFSRDKAMATDLLRDPFDPNYGPWEEVCEDSASMDFEDQEAMNESCVCKSCVGFSWSDHGVVDLSCGPIDRCGAIATRCAASTNPGVTTKSVKVEEVDKGKGLHGQGKWLHSPVNGNRKKKVIMGRDFLLVSRDWLQESKSGRTFQFFHKPSLSIAVVKVQEPTPMDLNPFDTPATGKENTHVEKMFGEPMVSETAAQNSLQVEDESTSLASCVSAVSMPNSHQPGSEEVSSGWVGEDAQVTIAGIRNLRSKRVLALWRYRPEVRGPTSAMQSGNRKRKKVDRVIVGGSHHKALSTPVGIKRKRERTIEDSYGDPHTFRCPQRRVLH